MIQCSNCEKWLDLQSDAIALDEGTLCQSCFAEWYPDPLTRPDVTWEELGGGIIEQEPDYEDAVEAKEVYVTKET